MMSFLLDLYTRVREYWENQFECCDFEVGVRGGGLKCRPEMLPYEVATSLVFEGCPMIFLFFLPIVYARSFMAFVRSIHIQIHTMHIRSTHFLTCNYSHCQTHALICEWCMVGCEYKNMHPKDTCRIEIELCAQNMLTILDIIVNVIEEDIMGGGGTYMII